MTRIKAGTRMVAAAAIVLNGLMAASPALAAQRAALVIGNAAYAHVPALANPLNDAADVGAALARLGFAVTRLDNTGHAQLRQGLLDFQRAASASEVAVVFYAGHGIEVDGRNFLVPVDARLASDQDVEFEAIPLALVSRAVSRASGLRLVVLDACRENPFAVSMQRAGATRSIGRGLARVEPSGETLVAYAAKEGTVAADGEGRNSPYSAALLRHLEEPGLEVGLMFRRVRDAVLRSTGGRQEPFVYGSLSSRGVYLASAPPASPSSTDLEATPSVGGPSPSRATAEQLAARAYEAAERLHAVAAYEAVLRRFPESVYADLAKAQIRRLKETPALSPAATDSPAVGPATPPAPPVPRVEPSPAPAGPNPEEAELSLGLERAERRLVQEGLASLGLSPGPADGLFGHRTREALRRYQGEKGLTETGYLTADEAQALVALGEESARREREKEEAERGADDESFARAKRLNTVAGYEEYLARGGRHESEARVLLAEVAKPRWGGGERFRDCPDCPELVVVPAGSYEMGSPSGEESRYDDEGPVHRVRISEPFAVGVYEVTFREWDACRRAGGCSHAPGDAGWGRGERPVIDVSWEDARAYVRWLSRETGLEYRLLSESEWEYVARAGTTSRYWWGDGVGRNRANCAGCGSRWDDDRTAPVGSFASNAFGLHDVHGNVWEWVEDCWHGSYQGAPSDGSAWTSGGDCGRPVLRGGSWLSNPGLLRSAIRIRYSAGSRSGNIGFRVARTLD